MSCDSILIDNLGSHTPTFEIANPIFNPLKIKLILAITCWLENVNML